MTRQSQTQKFLIIYIFRCNIKIHFRELIFLHISRVQCSFVHATLLSKHAVTLFCTLVSQDLSSPVLYDTCQNLIHHSHSVSHCLKSSALQLSIVTTLVLILTRISTAVTETFISGLVHNPAGLYMHDMKFKSLLLWRQTELFL